MNLTDPSFVWTPSTHTDITRTWAKYGWKPTHSRGDAMPVQQSQATGLSVVTGYQDGAVKDVSKGASPRKRLRKVEKA